VNARFISESLEDLEVACPNGVVAVTRQHQGAGVLGTDFRQHAEGTCRAVMKLKSLAAHQRSCGGSNTLAELRDELSQRESIIQQLQAEVKRLKEAASWRDKTITELTQTIKQMQASRRDLATAQEQIYSQEEEILSLRAHISSLTPTWRKCDSSEMGLLARMIFPLIDRGSVDTYVRNGIFNNIVALHKERMAGGPVNHWSLLVVSVLAARMSSMTATQEGRLMQIVRELLS
jgi:hypothetical protein